MIDLTKKKILVTGAHGFLGRHLVRNLLEKRKTPKENLSLPTVEHLDLRKWENCQAAVKNQDIIFHLAAVTGSGEFHRLNPGKIFYDNIMMGVQLMEAARLEGAEKFVAIGSVTAYPEKTPLPLKEDALWESYPQEIHAPYSFAKKMLLVQGSAYRQQYNFNAIHLMLTNLYGPGMDFNDNSYVIASLIKKIDEAKKAGRNFIELWGTGKPTRDFLYVEDAAEGILLAAERYDKPEPVNLGSGKDLSISKLAKLIFRLMDFQGKVRWDTSKPDGQPRRRLDIGRAQKEFGFKPKISLEDGLSRTVQWYYGK